MKSYRLVFLLCFGAVTALKLQCKFENVDFDQNYYICEVDNPRVDSTRTNVTGIDGEHFEGRTNQNVNCFKAHRSSLLRAMPSGLENFFHNLTMISIRNTRLKAITQESLKPFSELTVLDLMMNKLRVLESGLFKFNTKLKEIYFNDNHLNAIAPDIFEPLGDLELAYFSGNLCINIGTDYTGHSLDDVKKKIVDDCQNEPKIDPTYLFDVECASSSNIQSNDTAIYPFLVALMASKDSEFICGGSLITAKHVLTAAHCIHPTDKAPLTVEDIIFHFGLASLKEDQVKRSVEEIFIHNDWKRGITEADLAVLVAKQPIVFSDMIRPVCLMKTPIFLHSANGTVLKLKNSQEITIQPPQSQSYTFIDETCFGKQLNHNSSYLPRSFCGKNVNDHPCFGNSGFGFYVEFDDKWTLEGVQSEANESCNKKEYSSYTMISEFTFWLKFTVDGFL